MENSTGQEKGKEGLGGPVETTNSAEAQKKQTDASSEGGRSTDRGNLRWKGKKEQEFDNHPLGDEKRDQPSSLW